MKNMYLIITVLILFTGCKDEEVAKLDKSIYGTWKMVERFDGGSLKPFQPPAHEYLMIFGRDKSYSNALSYTGTFSINDTLIEIDLPKFKNMAIKYRYGIGDNGLILAPYPNQCDEGCYDRYVKISP
ncbi:hypothetical protein F7018_12600 [Tenacibaculum aiptasiae]|uniref:Lipocalin family protein n=1 Tax=Tenacibaculum aiptasiae TaxID=426481 RepID=A0A7J5ACK3_9FLAO|nr:hypothetical protein [Tenacibaculum aiptasiae]KAB1155307.1 hypothetical protein F7018_12600 [Tenacibaculum aiptasiae]